MYVVACIVLFDLSVAVTLKIHREFSKILILKIQKSLKKTFFFAFLVDVAVPSPQSLPRDPQARSCKVPSHIGYREGDIVARTAPGVAFRLPVA